MGSSRPYIEFMPGAEDVALAAMAQLWSPFEIQAVVRTGGVWGSPAVLEPQYMYAVNFTVAVAPNGDVLAAWRYDATTAADSGVAQVIMPFSTQSPRIAFDIV